MRKIYVSDITLKELLQSRDVSLLFREKTAIVSFINDLGVDAIELPPINNPREDTIVCNTISSLIKNIEVVIPVGFSAESTNEAWGCISSAQLPRLQVELPVSTVQMEYKYHLKSDKMLLKIKELCTAAKSLCDRVEFVANDASRAERDFLLDAIKSACECGADVITICDDAGVMLPDEIAELTRVAKQTVDAKVFVKISDRINMAIAGTYCALSAGADGVKASLFGENTLIMGKLSDTIKEKGEAIKICTSIKDTKIHTGVEELLKKINRNNFTQEKSAFEYKDEVLLDSDSTLAQVCDAARTLGYELSDEDNGLVYKYVMNVCEKKSSIGADELEAIIASNAMQAPSTYHLESYTTSCGNLINSMTQVTLKRDDEIIYGVSIGDGPIDASFRAIENSIGVHYELDDFTIQAVTEGKEALGSAIVRLRNNGKLYSGNGISSDIVGASIRAYINALNKIVFEEE